jgi:hypothetical protein
VIAPARSVAPVASTARRSWGARELAVCAGLVLATIVAVWASWPRPALTIVVERGGGAVVRARYAAALRPALPLPERIEVDAGSLVRIVNEDTAVARLGLFASAPGEDVTVHAPTAPGVFAGRCSAHPGRQVTYVIR